MRVVRKPSETEAWKVEDLKALEISEYPAPLLNAVQKGMFIGGDNWQVQTQSGWATCPDAYYLVVDVVGRIYPVAPDVFEATYEILDEEAASA